MPQEDSAQWVQAHGRELVGSPVESGIETLHGAGLKVMVSRFARPEGFPAPSSDRIYLHVDETQAIKSVEAG